MTEILNVKNLSFSFGQRPLFADVSFSLQSGRLIRLTGENGTGKSTMMLLLAGLRNGYSGTIEFNFLDNLDNRQMTSWMPADANALDPNLSAMDNLRFWQNLRGLNTDDGELRRVLANWGLEGLYKIENLPVDLFSTGMKRRLSIARLELSQTKLWLLDEPLFGLDDIACRQFRDFLGAHIQSGGSAVVITHDDRLVSNLNHDVLHLGRKGEKH
ncbi:MAG: heme ABC exporter ATP-binding protein CcmA [Proteobacteria bacterium]|nr:heme ABC exporter ATP-binding protein CcmA [Pseudomonadota bacterium]